MKILNPLPATDPKDSAPDHVQVFWSGQNDGWVIAVFSRVGYQCGDAIYRGHWYQPDALKEGVELAQEKGLASVKLYKRDGDLKRALKLSEKS